MKDKFIAILNSEFTRYWLPLFLWAGFIYWMSDQPNLKSSFEPLWDMILRKLAHLAEFGIFAFLMARLLDFYGVGGKRFWVIILAISLFYAVYSEVHQSFVQGRYGTVRDMLVNFNGAFLGAVFWGISKLKKKSRD